MKAILRFLKSEEDGATLAEYGLLIALVAAAMIGIVIAFKNKIPGLYNSFDPPAPTP